jgi:hypothetical protein
MVRRDVVRVLLVGEGAQEFSAPGNCSNGITVNATSQNQNGRLPRC